MLLDLSRPHFAHEERGNLDLHFLDLESREYTNNNRKYVFTQGIYLQYRENFEILKNKGYTRVVAGWSDNILAFKVNFVLGDIPGMKWLLFHHGCIALVVYKRLFVVMCHWWVTLVVKYAILCRKNTGGKTKSTGKNQGISSLSEWGNLVCNMCLKWAKQCVEKHRRCLH